MPVTINKGTALSALNLTPLIDVVFLLLIFFLVATRFAEEDRELEVMLPTASEAKPLVVKPREIFINIDKSGNHFLGNRMLNADDLEQALRRANVNNPLGQTVIVRADKRCLWDAVAVAIDACHRAGIHDVRPTCAGDD
jgi:biopolymer transport protein ExbD